MKVWVTGVRVGVGVRGSGVKGGFRVSVVGVKVWRSGLRPGVGVSVWLRGAVMGPSRDYLGKGLRVKDERSR